MVKGKNKSKRNLIILLIVIGALVFGVTVFRIVTRIIENSRKPAPLAFSVGSQILKKQWVDEALTLEGLVEGDPQVFIYSQVSGKFQYNTVMEGALVYKDQAISYIDRDIVGQTFELAPVRSSINGIVAKLFFIDRGEPVTTEKPVAEVANPNSIKIVLSLGIDDLMKVKKGMTTRIYYEKDTNLNLDGTVYSVPPYIESDILSGNVTVKAVNKNMTLKVGMTVGVDIRTGKVFSFVVPEQSVITSLDEIYVFVNNHGIARQVNVNRGYSWNGQVEVQGDLNEGDEIITEGAFKLSDGDRIKTSTQQNGSQQPSVYSQQSSVTNGAAGLTNRHQSGKMKAQ